MRYCFVNNFGNIDIAMKFLKILTLVIVPSVLIGSIGINRSKYLSSEEEMTEARFQLGRRLFYDPILSGNNKISCSSCHIQQFAFADTSRFSKGINDKALNRNTMSLVNLSWDTIFFWDGRIRVLEDQILIPITHPDEMAQDLNLLLKEIRSHKIYPQLFTKAFGNDRLDTNQIKYSLAHFVRSIVSANSPMDKMFSDPSMRVQNEHIANSMESDFDAMVNLFDKGLSSQFFYVQNAMQKVNKKKYSEKAIKAFVLCIQCHDKNFMGGPSGMKNNGLEINVADPGLGAITLNAKDSGLFKVPTLRNILYTAPYMHDGRFKTIDEVLEHYNSGIQNHPNLNPLLKENGGAIRLNLSESDKQEIIEFLSLITDDSLFINKRYSNPFVN